MKFSFCVFSNSQGHRKNKGSRREGKPMYGTSLATARPFLLVVTLRSQVPNWYRHISVPPFKAFILTATHDILTVGPSPFRPSPNIDELNKMNGGASEASAETVVSIQNFSNYICIN